MLFSVEHENLQLDAHGDPGFQQSLYITGNCDSLGNWSEELAVGPMILDNRYAKPTYTLVVDLPSPPSDGAAAPDIRYKYIVKRGSMLVKWETIPPPFRVVSPADTTTPSPPTSSLPLTPPPPSLPPSMPLPLSPAPPLPPPAPPSTPSESAVSPRGGRRLTSLLGLSPKQIQSKSPNLQPTMPPAQDVFARLPMNHPKRKSGKSLWVDRKLVTVNSGEEVRLMIGGSTIHKGIVLDKAAYPKNLGLRLHWKAKDNSPLSSISTSNGNIQARSVRFIKTETENDIREAEHHSKILSYSGKDEYSTFKFNASLEAVISGDNVQKHWLELDLIDMDLHGVCATGHISLQNFVNAERTRGAFRVPLFARYRTANQTPVGEAFVEFLVIKPFVHPNNGMQYSFRRYWTGYREGRDTLDIGHRGAGRSYRDVTDQAEIRENTLLSFSEAGKAGAEYVELDINLTKDREAVVFHDFAIGIHGNNITDKKQPVSINVNQLTLEQLKTLYTIGTDAAEFKEGITNKSGLVKASYADLSSLMKSPSVEDVKKKSRQQHLLDVPTLRELLMELPIWLGLNVEIKYPVGTNVDWLSRLPSMEINAYLDDILNVVFTYVGRRRIVFSCFNPDVCSALKMKQSRFPVSFLTGENPARMTDQRCTSLTTAVSFAESEYLLGIVPNSKALFCDSEGNRTEVEADMVGKAAVERCHKKDVVVFTWGDLNTFTNYVALQRKWKVDAVICDNIGKLAKMHKDEGEKSLFEKKYEAEFEKEFSEKLRTFSSSNLPGSPQSPRKSSRKKSSVGIVGAKKGPGGKKVVSTRSLGDAIADVGWIPKIALLGLLVAGVTLAGHGRKTR
jgi:glycerophosphoryl diester phosphodiesterase